MTIKEDYGLKKIWDARHHISEKCDYDTEKLMKYYQTKQKQHKNRLVSSTTTSHHMLSEKKADYNKKLEEKSNG